MNCRQSRGLFGAYWDDEMTQAEREVLESHFSGCTACRQEYEAFAHALELVGSLPRTEVMPGLAERALARARRAAPVPDRLPVAQPRWVPLTATAALLVIAGVLVAQWSGLGPSSIARRGGTPDRVAVAVIQPSVPTQAPVAKHEQAVIPDSLFDHAEDIEFILDPVTIRKGRAVQTLRPAPQEVQGEQAVITF